MFPRVRDGGRDTDHEIRTEADDDDDADGEGEQVEEKEDEHGLQDLVWHHLPTQLDRQHRTRMQRPPQLEQRVTGDKDVPEHLGSPSAQPPMNMSTSRTICA